MCGPPQAVIFDFDGTLVQTRLASWEVFRRVNERFSLGVDTVEQFHELFGNNLFAALRERCRDEQQAREVLQAFNAALETDYHPQMVPGICDVVRGLAPQCTLAVLSSNVTGVLRRVLLDNGIAYCFAHVFGGDVEPDKRRGIQRFLADAAQGAGRRCAVYYDEGQPVTRCDNGAAVLVTDTVGDVRAAIASGIRAVGVSWGMHTEAELLDAGCEFVAIWPQEILAALRGDGAEGCSCAVPDRPRTVSGNTDLQRSAELRRQRRAHASPAAAQAPVSEPPAAPVSVSSRTLDEQLVAAMRRMLA